MFSLFRRKRQLSETVKAVLWLWENDQKNWVMGTHAVVHEPTGVGVWIGNEEYGIKIVYNIPNRDRATGFSCNGRDIKLNAFERATMHAVIVRGASGAINAEVRRQISNWTNDKTRHDVTLKPVI